MNYFTVKFLHILTLFLIIQPQLFSFATVSTMSASTPLSTVIPSTVASMSAGTVAPSIAISLLTHSGSTERNSKEAESSSRNGWIYKNTTGTNLLIQSFIMPNEMKSTVISKESVKFIGSVGGEYPIIISRTDEPQIDWPIKVSDLPDRHPQNDGACEHLIIQENEDQDTFDVISVSQGAWLLCNRTLSTDNSKANLFYAWYKTKDETLRKKRLTVPRTLGISGLCTPVYLPSQKRVSLVLSRTKDDLNTEMKDFSKNCLEIPSNTLEEKFPKKEIVITGSDAQILNTKVGNYLNVINTTNKPLYCTLFKNNAIEKRVVTLFEYVQHQIRPQMRTLIPQPDSSSDRQDLKLVVSINPVTVDIINANELPENVYVYSLPSKDPFRGSLLITTKLNSKSCPFELKRFEEASPNILPHIFATINSEISNGLIPARRSFSPGSLAELEQEIAVDKNSESDQSVSSSSGASSNSSFQTCTAKITSLAKEQTFLDKRKKIVWEGIIKLLGEGELKKLLQEIHIDIGEQKLNEYLATFPAPKIALVLAGDGYKAMIETLGFLQGAEKEGVLDCCSYMCGLSGSTWAITSLVASGMTIKKFVHHQRAKVAIPEVYENFAINSLGRKTLDQLMRNVIPDAAYIRRTLIQGRFNQPQGIVGFYGHALAHRLLDEISCKGKSKHDITLSDLQTNLEEGRYPLPICMCIDSSRNPENQKWFEFSPYYIGTYKTGIQAGKELTYIHTEQFGSLFENGTLIQHSPEYPLAQLWGVWGSAFGFKAEGSLNNRFQMAEDLVQAIESFDSTAENLYKNILDVTNFVPRLLPSNDFDDRRQISQHNKQLVRTSAKQSKYFFESNNTFKMEDLETQKLFDESRVHANRLDHDFAATPALAREVDALILCDCTSRKNEHLSAVSKEARKWGLAFPKVSEEDVNGANNEYNVSTLVTEDSKPSVVYIKCKRYNLGRSKGVDTYSFDPDRTNTENFSYSPDEYDSLRKLARDIITHKKAMNDIKKAVRKSIANSIANHLEKRKTVQI